MLILNRLPEHGAPLAPADHALVAPEAAAAVARFWASCPDHRPTPLHDLPGLARALGVGTVAIKDEGHRLGLGSFKALGGAYALARLVIEQAGAGTADYAALLAPEVRAVASTMTFACATDGNHGRSVALGARLVGGRAVIFMHEGVSDERVAAIAAFGAEIVRVAGTYDDSVDESARLSEANGWALVSDTAWPGYERVPGLVMQGYTLLVREALEALAEPPTHVFIQAGVGGLAAAVAGHFATLSGPGPRTIIVEPERAACLFESLRAGALVEIPQQQPTVMAMLECYRASLVAWRILSRTADAFMTVAEEDAVEAMNRLARPAAGDPAIVAGESGGAGLAGLLRACREPGLRAQLGLDGASRILLINSEGATDPSCYRALVGIEPAMVAAQASGVRA